jgi:sugar phosphate isomerase/epimerase
MSIACELVLYAGCLPATPFRDLVAAAADAGFDAITVWPLTYQRAISREGLGPTTMRQVVDDAGIRVTDLDPCGDWVPIRTVDDVPAPFRARWRRHHFFEAAAALGADTIVAVDLGGGSVERIGR